MNEQTVARKLCYNYALLYAVTGESGSGKIWFAKQSLRRQTNLEVAAFIYKEIGDEDAGKFKSLSSSLRILFFSKKGNIDCLQKRIYPIVFRLSWISHKVIL